MRRASFMHHDRANFFSGPYLERRAEAREDPDWIATARADPATLYLVGHGTAHLLHAQSPPRIAFLAHGAPPVRERSEEHTSELQSLAHPVRRLLLETRDRE